MGATGISLKVSGDGDRGALGSAIWAHAFNFVCNRTGLRPADDLWYYLDEGMEHEVDGDQLYWWFADLAGCCGRSQHVWLHWLALAFAADWDRLARLAAEHGLTLVSERPELADLLAGGNLVGLRKNLWVAGEEGLFGDDEHIPLADLTAEERTRHAEARRRCLCLVCDALQ